MPQLMVFVFTSEAKITCTSYIFKHANIKSSDRICLRSDSDLCSDWIRTDVKASDIAAPKHKLVHEPDP